MKNIHIPTIEELMRPDDEFGIEKLADGYKISGIQHRNVNCIYTLGMGVITGRPQDLLASFAKQVEPHHYRPASAPLIHAICKTLYRNRDGKQKEIVEDARKFLNDAFKSKLHTLSAVFYHTSGGARVIHNLGQADHYHIDEEIAGSSGLINDRFLQASKACKALLEDNDLEEINNTYKWITGLDTYIRRQEIYVWRPEEIIEVRAKAVTLAMVEPDFFVINANENQSNHLPALGVK